MSIRQRYYTSPGQQTHATLESPHMNLASRPPLRRLVLLDQMLRRQEYPNARSAARDLEVCERTVHRDLDFLRDSWGTRRL